MGAFTNSRKIICQNSYGYKLEFAYKLPFFLQNYSGIHEYAGSVATIKSAFGVGVSYVGTSVNSRNIVLTVAFMDDNSMQKYRNQLYNIFPLKDFGTLYFYEGNITRKINYYVEKVTSTKKARYWYYTISLICPSPYFMDSEETIAVIQNWNKLFHFKLEIPEGTGFEFGSKNENTVIEIENNSHINYGLTITLIANGTVINPIIKNIANNETMKLNYILNSGEQVVITTYNNEKTIIHIDSNGKKTNINNSLAFGTKFLQASNGVNKYSIDADSNSENLECSISYYNYYEAI